MTNEIEGRWLGKTKACAAIGVYAYRFDEILPTLKQRPTGKKQKTIEFFIPYSMMKDDYKRFYMHGQTTIDEDEAKVVDVLGDISTPEFNEDDLNAARLENIRMRTKVLEQQLEAKKTQLFSEWSSKFFDVFSASFAKFKNDLISLHLTEEQINLLESKIDFALKTMEDKLTLIETEWMNEEDSNE